jgi:hypothetical protein
MCHRTGLLGTFLFSSTELGSLLYEVNMLTMMTTEATDAVQIFPKNANHRAAKRAVSNHSGILEFTPGWHNYSMWDGFLELRNKYPGTHYCYGIVWIMGVSLNFSYYITFFCATSDGTKVKLSKRARPLLE